MAIEGRSGAEAMLARPQPGTMRAILGRRMTVATKKCGRRFLVDGGWNMSNDHETPKPDVIELAMGRMARDAEVPAGGGAESAVAGRREYDQALSRRLQQIRAALGNDDQPVSAHPAFAPERRSAPVTAPPFPMPGTGRNQSYGIRSLLLTGLVSAVAGASMMWLATSGVGRGSPRETPTAVAPVAAVATPAKVAVPAPQPADGEARARELVERWRQAWAARDIEAYLACYSEDFVAANGQPRSNWAAARRTKLASQSEIVVQVHRMSFERIADDRLKVEFQQDYSSGSYVEIAQPKTLLLVRTNGDWLIAGEWSGTREASALGGR